MATTMMAPMSSTMAAAVRKMRSSTGTREPMMAISATANAVSVAMGTPQPCAQGPLGTSDTYIRAGTTMPPTAAAMGRAALRRVARCPTVNSRFISRPTTRKNTVSNASFTQCTSDMLNAASPKPRDSGVSQKRVNAGPASVLVRMTANSVASSSSRPVDGAQLAKPSAATRTRWPSEPSMASVNDASSQGPS